MHLSTSIPFSKSATRDAATLFSGEDQLFHALMEADVIVRHHLLAAMCTGDVELQNRLEQRLAAVAERE